MINSSFYFIRNPIFSVAENRDFGRFVTTWYSVHCKHTRFFEFLGLLNEFVLEEAWFWGVRVGFGGREGALASALIYHDYIKIHYIKIHTVSEWHGFLQFVDVS